MIGRFISGFQFRGHDGSLRSHFLKHREEYGQSRVRLTELASASLCFLSTAIITEQSNAVLKHESNEQISKRPIIMADLREKV